MQNQNYVVYNMNITTRALKL